MPKLSFLCILRFPCVAHEGTLKQNYSGMQNKVKYSPERLFYMRLDAQKKTKVMEQRVGIHE